MNPLRVLGREDDDMEELLRGSSLLFFTITELVEGGLEALESDLKRDALTFLSRLGRDFTDEAYRRWEAGLKAQSGQRN